jgi:hypothetical protein
MNTIDDEDDSSDFLLSDCLCAQTRMSDLRNRLLDQQAALKRIIPILVKKPVQSSSEAAELFSEPVQSTSEPVQSTSEPVQLPSEAVQSRSEPVQYRSEPVQLTREPVESRTNPIQTASGPVPMFEGPKVCPMCESQFSSTRFSQEDFETHVLAHFQVSIQDIIMALI